MSKKSVLITGASGSLGSELVKKYIEYGYFVVLHSRNKKTSSNQINGHTKKNYEIVTGDLKIKSTINKISKVIIKKKVDIIINNAGIYLNKPFVKNSTKEILDIFYVNFFSNVFILQKLISKINKKLLIININSAAGLNGSVNESIYAASKHAMKGFYESLDKEYFGKKIDVLNIYPGAFKSKITKKRKTFNDLMKPNEIANVIFEASRDYSSLKITSLNLIRNK